MNLGLYYSNQNSIMNNIKPWLADPVEEYVCNLFDVELNKVLNFAESLYNAT